MANQSIPSRSRKPYIFDGDLFTATAVAAGANVTGRDVTVDLGTCDRVTAYLSITALTNGLVGDTIDVTVQGTWNPYDASPIWLDIMSFSQTLGNAAVPVQRTTNITHGQLTSTDVGAALTVATSRHIPCVQYRVKYTIVDAAGGDLRVSFKVSLLAKSS